MPNAKVIVNPAAGAWSTRRKWHCISNQLKQAGLSFDAEFTEGVGHAAELAQAAVNGGYRYLVAVGGDGTVNEVASGILRSTELKNTVLGVIGTGTANDFVRSAGIPLDCAEACSILASPRRRLFDVGVVECKCGGQSIERYFVNIAGVGFAAAIVAAAKKVPKNLGGIFLYMVGFPRSLFSYRNKTVVLRLGDKIDTERIMAVVVANGRYAGYGMNIAPRAELGDGLLDVVIIGDLGKFEVLKTWPMVYKGTHVIYPKIRQEKVSRLTIESSDKVLVQADGELLGECPASFRIMPSALTVVA
jgi:YegS/Rv2252/BmrU family lipid kinase